MATQLLMVTENLRLKVFLVVGTDSIIMVPFQGHFALSLYRDIIKSKDKLVQTEKKKEKTEEEQTKTTKSTVKVT